MKRLMTLATITACLGLASLSRADAISVNFEGGQGANPGSNVTSIAGYIQVDNWNNATGVSGTLSNLDDDSGNSSGASITWQTFNLWDLKNGDGSGDDEDLMSGYLDNIGASGPSDIITISGVPYDEYNVYIYFNRAEVTYTGITVSDGSSSETLYAKDTGATYPLGGGYNGYIVSTDDNIGDGWTDANVIKFTGFTGSTITITPAANPGVAPASWKVYMQGIQVLERTHEIRNGSFEAESLTASVNGGDTEIGTYMYVEESNIGSGSWGYTQPANWVHPGWGKHVHMITDTGGGTAVFPDGDFAIQLYDLYDGGFGGGSILKQEHIYLETGKLYEFSVDAWSGAEAGNAFIKVILVGTGTTTVMDSLTVTKDSAYETMSARFSVPKTEEYALWIYSEDEDPYEQSDLFIDNVALEWIPAGALIIVR